MSVWIGDLWRISGPTTIFRADAPFWLKGVSLNYKGGLINDYDHNGNYQSFVYRSPMKFLVDLGSETRFHLTNGSSIELFIVKTGRFSLRSLRRGTLP